MIAVFGSGHGSVKASSAILKSYFHSEPALHTERGSQDCLFSALSALWLAEADNRSCLFTSTGSTGI